MVAHRLSESRNGFAAPSVGFAHLVGGRLQVQNTVYTSRLDVRYSVRECVCVCQCVCACAVSMIDVIFFGEVSFVPPRGARGYAGRVGTRGGARRIP